MTAATATPLDAVDHVEARQAELRSSARRALGLTDAGLPPVSAAWPVAGPLAGLAMAAELPALGLFLFGPEISASLGTGRGGLGALVLVRALALSLAALVVAAVVHDRPRRAAICIAAGWASALVTLATAFVTSAGGLLGVLVVNGVLNAPVEAVHRPLLVDSAPPGVRVRALSIHRAGFAVALALAPLVASFTTAVGTSWRAAFLVMGLLSLAAAAGTVALRDPGFGRFDLDRVRELVRADPPPEPAGLRFFESVRRLLTIASVRRLLAVFAVLGVASFPLMNSVFFFLDEQWGMGPGPRSLFLAGAGVSCLAVLAWARTARRCPLPGGAGRSGSPGRRAPGGGGDRDRRGRGGSPLRGDDRGPGAGAWGGHRGEPVAARPPAFGDAPEDAATRVGAGGTLPRGRRRRRRAAAPRRHRPPLRRRRARWSRWSIPGVVGALMLRGVGAARRRRPRPHDRRDHRGRGDPRHRSGPGGHLPMLACRGIDFSYGQLQVLFDVDFTVDDGEMVALLGTNGAGKSTLLQGHLRHRPAERGAACASAAPTSPTSTPSAALRLGITQIPGGRAVFGPMTVVENLRGFGYTLGRDRASRRRGASTRASTRSRAWPSAATSCASTLSGGEQQMLGLSQGAHPRARGCCSSTSCRSAWRR